MAELTTLRHDMVAESAESADRLRAVHPNFRLSARNLLHYLALRRHDRRPLQDRLAALGLSSLGRAEAHVLATVDAVRTVLNGLSGTDALSLPAEAAPDISSGARLLAEHSAACLGPPPASREVQEEILWLCEAAHVPVIWATQVLESLARGGRPSRAEITDAAMGDRAECVMLNKGPRVGEAVQILSNILQRMQGHQRKKSALLRRLHVAEKYSPT